MAPVNVYMRQDVVLNVYPEPSFRRALVEPLRVIVGLAVGLPSFVRAYEMAHGKEANPDLPLVSLQIVCVGLPMVTLGLALFAIGLRDGLMPLGDLIGRTLMHEKREMVPGVGFALGLLLTFGEPAIGALVEVAYVAWEFPTIQGLLGAHQELTVGGIGSSVGLAVSLGCWRLSRADHGGGWSLSQMITPVVLICLAVTTVTPLAAQGLAWDAGAVTTGPITVPVVLALGAGLASEGRPAFGVVTFASLMPVISVTCSCHAIQLWKLLTGRDTSAERPARAEHADDLLQVAREEAILTARSFLPLSLGLISVLFYLKIPWRVLTTRPVPRGLGNVLLGLYAFFVGIKVGVLPMGRNGGMRLTEGVFCEDGAVDLTRALGILLFGFLTIFACQMIEPDLLVLGAHPSPFPSPSRHTRDSRAGRQSVPRALVAGGQAETMSLGRVSKLRLVATVSVGCGIGTVVGILKVLLNVPLLLMLIPPYLIALALTRGQDDFIVGLAWDAAGTTTGSITVPLILALGLGIAEQVDTAESDVSGFASLGPLGVLGCASVWPICTVLIAFRSRAPTSAVAVINDDWPAEQRPPPIASGAPKGRPASGDAREPTSPDCVTQLNISQFQVPHQGLELQVAHC